MDLNSGSGDNSGIQAPRVKGITSDSRTFPNAISIVSEKRAQSVVSPKEFRRKPSGKRRKKRKMAKILKENTKNTPVRVENTDCKSGLEKTRMAPVIEVQLDTYSVEIKQPAFSPKSTGQNMLDFSAREQPTPDVNEEPPALDVGGPPTMKAASLEEMASEKELSPTWVKLEIVKGSAHDQSHHIWHETIHLGSPALDADGLRTVKSASPKEKISKKGLSTSKVELVSNNGFVNDKLPSSEPESDQWIEEKEILQNDDPLMLDEKENFELDKAIIIPANQYPTYNAYDIRDCHEEAQSLRTVVIMRLVPATAVVVIGVILLYFLLSHS